MSAPLKKASSPAAKRQIQRIVGRLLTAIDRAITAIDDVREARDILFRVSRGGGRRGK